MSDLATFVTPDGARTAYRIVGDGPTTLTALHSLALDGSWFEPFARALGAGYRVVLPDTRGHGGSDSIETEVDLPTLGRDVVALWDHLGIARSAVVGVSMGGMIAQAVASLAPDRVEALVLVATVRAYPDVAKAPARERADQARRPGGMAAMADELAERWFGDDPSPSSKGLQPRAADQVRTADAASHAAVLEAMTAVGELDLDAYAGPTLVVAGAADRSTPEVMVRAAADQIDGARFTRCPGGHLAPFTHPTDVADLVAGFVKESS